MPTKCMELFKYGGHCNGQIMCCKNRATVGREREKEPRFGWQKSNVELGATEP